MKIFDGVIENINRGKEGLNSGLTMGFKRLTQYIPNIQQGTYYVVGGETSSGKTAFVDNSFIYNPYDYLKKTETNFTETLPGIVRCLEDKCGRSLFMATNQRVMK